VGPLKIVKSQKANLIEQKVCHYYLTQVNGVTLFFFSSPIKDYHA